MPLYKLDLGCGRRIRPGYLRLDISPNVHPDICCDLDVGIPLEDNTVEEIQAIAVLEHCHNTLHIINEMWRVCVHGAKIHIEVPDWSCDAAWQDPTHVKGFTRNSASYWDKRSGHYSEGADYGVKSTFSSIRCTEIHNRELEGFSPGDQEFRVKYFRNIILRLYFDMVVDKELTI